MEGKAGFAPLLQETLGRYRDHLDKTGLPALKDQVRILYTAFSAIRNVLLKKALIHEDPYKNDTKISEISTPPDTPYLESEKTDQMSVRLSMFESQLDFLLNYYQFSTEFLDMTRIKLLVSLLRYISWEQLSETTQDMTTRGLAEYVGRIKRGADALSVGIINDSLEQINKYTRLCLGGLRDLAEFQKEAYKLEVRLGITETMGIVPERAVSGREDVLRQIRKRFAAEFPGKPFYPELIHEIIDEDHGPNGGELRNAVLAKLTVKETKSGPASQQVSFSAMLLDAIRSLAAASRYLEEASQKLSDNNILLQSRKMSLFERLKKWLGGMHLGKNSALTYEVEYFDITTSSSKREPIPFEAFIEDVRKHARMYGGIMSKAGTLYRKMEMAGESQLDAFLGKHMEELNVMFRRLEALDAFFKRSVDNDQRPSLRGIKIELTAIKNNMVKANQKKHEYSSRKEEAEQLKKLGFGQT